MKVAVTEYNGMYFNEESRRTRSLESALQVGGQINLFARRNDLIEVNFLSTLVNFWDGGASGSATAAPSSRPRTR